MRQQHAELPRLRPGRDTRPTSSRPSTRSARRSGWPSTSGGCRRRRAGPGRPRHGDAQRAHAGRLAGGLSADRPARASSPATSRSSTSSTRCSTSTPSGWRSATSCPGGAKVSSLNLLITSTVWRQDHNGFTHQDPGFLDVVVNKSPEVVPHLPAAGRQLPAVRRRPLPAQHQLHQRHRRGQAGAPAVPGHGRGHRALHQGRRHLGLGQQRPGRGAGRGHGGCGDMPTMEALAATALLREHLPDLKIRFVNVVDLFRLVPSTEHPHGLTDREFDALFTADKPVIFNFHGYPWLIHRLTYRRPRPRQHARARLQGEGQHQHAAGAGDPQPDRPLQPGDRRHRPGAAVARQGIKPREDLLDQQIDLQHTPMRTASTSRRS